MEVVGFTAAALSLAKATQAMYKFTKLLYRAAKYAGNLEPQIRTVTVPFETSRYALMAAMAHLEHHCMDGGKTTPALEYLTGESFFAALAEQALNIIAQIKALYGKINTINATGRPAFRAISKLQFVKSFKWTIMKPDIEALGPSIESFKMTLVLAVTVFNAERKCNEKADNPESAANLRKELYVLHCLASGHSTDASPEMFLKKTSRGRSRPSGVCEKSTITSPSHDQHLLPPVVFPRSSTRSTPSSLSAISPTVLLQRGRCRSPRPKLSSFATGVTATGPAMGLGLTCEDPGERAHPPPCRRLGKAGRHGARHHPLPRPSRRIRLGTVGRHAAQTQHLPPTLYTHHTTERGPGSRHGGEPPSFCPLLWNTTQQGNHARLLARESHHPHEVVKINTHRGRNAMAVDWQKMPLRGRASRRQKSLNTSPNLDHMRALPRPRHPSVPNQHPSQEVKQFHNQKHHLPQASTLMTPPSQHKSKWVGMSSWRKGIP